MFVASLCCGWSACRWWQGQGHVAACWVLGASTACCSSCSAITDLCMCMLIVQIVVLLFASYIFVCLVTAVLLVLCPTKTQLFGCNSQQHTLPQQGVHRLAAAAVATFRTALTLEGISSCRTRCTVLQCTSFVLVASAFCGVTLHAKCMLPFLSLFRSLPQFVWFSAGSVRFESLLYCKFTAQYCAWLAGCAWLVCCRSESKRC
jgi:hypothetical protein